MVELIALQSLQEVAVEFRLHLATLAMKYFAEPERPYIQTLSPKSIYTLTLVQT